MITLALTIVVLILAYFVQTSVPAVAGLLAVVPIKIISVLAMAPSREIARQSLDGVIIGQFAWGVVFLGLRFWWAR